MEYVYLRLIIGSSTRVSSLNGPVEIIFVPTPTRSSSLLMYARAPSFSWLSCVMDRVDYVQPGTVS